MSVLTRSAKVESIQVSGGGLFIDSVIVLLDEKRA